MGWVEDYGNVGKKFKVKQERLMPRRCFVDLDGVLVNMIKGVEKVFGLYNFLYTKTEHLGVWDIWKLLNIPEELFWDKIDFYGFWSDLEWMPDGREILSIIENHYGKENIAIMTSPCRHSHCSAAKQWWIQQHLPDYARRFLITPAKEFLADSGHMLIDDYDRNIDLYAESGGSAFLLPRPWNRLHGVDPILSLKKMFS